MSAPHRPVIVRTPDGEVMHADAAYFAGGDDGVMELFNDDLEVIARYEPGEWRSAIRMGAKL